MWRVKFEDYVQVEDDIGDASDTELLDQSLWMTTRKKMKDHHQFQSH